MRTYFEIIKASNGWVLNNVMEEKSLFCGEKAETLAEALRLWLVWSSFTKAAIYVKDRI